MWKILANTIRKINVESTPEEGKVAAQVTSRFLNTITPGPGKQVCVLKLAAAGGRSTSKALFARCNKAICDALEDKNLTEVGSAPFKKKGESSGFAVHAYRPYLLPPAPDELTERCAVMSPGLLGQYGSVEACREQIETALALGNFEGNVVAVHEHEGTKDIIVYLGTETQAETVSRHHGNFMDEGCDHWIRLVRLPKDLQDLIAAAGLAKRAADKRVAPALPTGDGSSQAEGGKSSGAAGSTMPVVVAASAGAAGAASSGVEAAVAAVEEAAKAAAAVEAAAQIAAAAALDTAAALAKQSAQAKKVAQKALAKKVAAAKKLEEDLLELQKKLNDSKAEVAAADAANEKAAAGVKAAATVVEQAKMAATSPVTPTIDGDAAASVACAGVEAADAAAKTVVGALEAAGAAVTLVATGGAGETLNTAPTAARQDGGGPAGHGFDKPEGNEPEDVEPEHLKWGLDEAASFLEDADFDKWEKAQKVVASENTLHADVTTDAKDVAATAVAKAAAAVSTTGGLEASAATVVAQVMSPTHSIADATAPTFAVAGTVGAAVTAATGAKAAVTVAAVAEAAAAAPATGGHEASATTVAAQDARLAPVIGDTVANTVVDAAVAGAETGSAKVAGTEATATAASAMIDVTGADATAETTAMAVSEEEAADEEANQFPSFMAAMDAGTGVNTRARSNDLPYATAAGSGDGTLRRSGRLSAHGAGVPLGNGKGKKKKRKDNLSPPTSPDSKEASPPASRQRLEGDDGDWTIATPGNCSIPIHTPSSKQFGVVTPPSRSGPGRAGSH
jgi:hypothetical protein